MNNTNRAANRLFLLTVGVIVIILGAAAIAVGMLPDVRSAWTDIAPATASEVNRVLGEAATAWIWYALLAGLLLTMIVLVAFIFRQGHGHTGRLVSTAETAAGSTIIESSFAEQLLASALRERPEFVSAGVSTYQVRRRPVVKVAITARRGVSPTDVVDIVERATTDLDSLLGVQVPTLIHISGGFRSRTTSATRLR
ncbi:MAG: hypothetical protein RI885_713 [Actinomycetota bacterium]